MERTKRHWLEWDIDKEEQSLDEMVEKFYITVNAQDELVKFADDLTQEVPGYDYGDTSMIEVSNIN